MTLDKNGENDIYNIKCERNDSGEEKMSLEMWQTPISSHYELFNDKPFL